MPLIAAAPEEKRQQNIAAAPLKEEDMDVLFKDFPPQHKARAREAYRIFSEVSKTTTTTTLLLLGLGFRFDEVTCTSTSDLWSSIQIVSSRAIDLTR